MMLAKTYRSGGSVVVAIPKEIRKVIALKEGDLMVITLGLGNALQLKKVTETDLRNISRKEDLDE